MRQTVAVGVIKAVEKKEATSEASNNNLSAKSLLEEMEAELYRKRKKFEVDEKVFY
jgi:hypothetical protein